MAPRRNWLFLVSLVSLVALGLLLLARSVPSWVATVAVLLPWLVCLVLAVWRRASPPPPAQVIRVDEAGVERQVHGETTERVTWGELCQVDVVTTSDGPFGDDFFWVLRGAEGAGCAIPSTLAHDLLARLQRLHRFDNEQVVCAAGSITEARFACWKGEAGEALVAATPPPVTPKATS